MARVMVLLEDDVEAFMRKNLIHKKGDLSKVINEGLRKAWGLKV